MWAYSARSAIYKESKEATPKYRAGGHMAYVCMGHGRKRGTEAMLNIMHCNVGPGAEHD